MTEIDFIVYGEPFGKQRPRFNHYSKRTYTPTETVVKEEAIALMYEDKYPDTKFGDNDALEITIEAYMSIPKSASKKKHNEMAQNRIRPTKKPDWDNIGKLVTDALNGIAYRDDSQVVTATVCKFYGGEPMTRIKIRKVADFEEYSVTESEIENGNSFEYSEENSFEYSEE